jgi:hypothetical protein
MKGLGQYIESQKIFKELDIDFEIFAFNIVTFTFFLISDKKRGKLFNDHDAVFNKFIEYSVRCIGY